MNPAEPEFGVLGGGKENLTVAEAIKVFTWNGAYAIGKEKELGSIESGKHADFVVIDRDLFKTEPVEIGGTKALMTVLGGRIVYAVAEDFIID